MVEMSAKRLILRRDGGMEVKSVFERRPWAYDQLPQNVFIYAQNLAWDRQRPVLRHQRLHDNYKAYSEASGGILPQIGFKICLGPARSGLGNCIGIVTVFTMAGRY